MSILRFPGYCAGDDLRGEPSSWLIFDTETKERHIELNPAYVPPPPLTEQEELEQEIARLEIELEDARAYLAFFGTRLGTSVDTTEEDAESQQTSGESPESPPRADL